MVVVEIHLAQSQAEDTLPDQGFRAVLGRRGSRSSHKRRATAKVSPISQIKLTQQLNADARGDITAIKAGGDLTAFAASEGSGRSGTFFMVADATNYWLFLRIITAFHPPV